MRTRAEKESSSNNHHYFVLGTRHNVLGTSPGFAYLNLTTLDTVLTDEKTMKQGEVTFQVIVVSEKKDLFDVNP